MEQEKPIAEVKEPKEAFFDFKIHRFLKRPKICIFPKGLDHGYCSKTKPFSIYCFNSK